MPNPYSIPYKQADGNGHYRSKQLPDDQQDFLIQLGVPEVFGDVMTGETVTVTGQMVVWYGTDGHVIKAVPIAVSGVVVLNGGIVATEVHPAGDLVGTDAVQTLTNKTFGAGIVFGAGTTFTGGVVGLTKFDVGLGNVDNTSDAAKNAAVATLTNKTIASPSISNVVFTGTVTGLSKVSVGLGNVDNTSDVNKPISNATQTALDDKENLARYNTANGYAPLGADTKVPLANLPDAVLGASRYQGTWNAATNIPPIPPAAPSNNGWYYVVSVPGNTNIDGINQWLLGDWVISNGQYWQKVPNTDAVLSVNAKTGAVVLVKADIGLGNVDNTSDATKNSQAATLTNKVISGANNTLTVRLDADVSNSLPVNRLNGGTGANSTTFWRGDGQWVSPTGSGDVIGPSTSVDGEVVLYSGTTGKAIRTFGGAVGFAKVGAGAALTTVPKIGALDVDPSIVHGQTLKTSVVALDEFLLWDSVSLQLRCVRSETVRTLPRSYLSGLALANSVADVVNDIDVAVGVCRDSTDSADIKLVSSITKQLDAAWAAGTNQGGLDTGAIANTTYHVFLIRRSDTGNVDVLFSASATAPTLPANYTHFRRIGSIVRLSGAIKGFIQTGDDFTWKEGVENFGGGPVGTTSVIATLTVPTGIQVLSKAQYTGYKNAPAGGTFVLVSSLEQPDVLPASDTSATWILGIGAVTASTYGGSFQQTKTNLSGQVRIRASGTININYAFCLGWVDRRGRDD
jgi:hypothetical protein